MRWFRPVLLFLLLLIIPIGCITPAALGVPISFAPATASTTAQPTYVLSGPGATATPTPFQPLSPTAIFQPTGFPTETPFPTPTPIITIPAEGSPPEQELTKLPSQINILLLGSDMRRWGGGFRTDTIVLVTLNSELGNVNITSFPRDLYVTIPGWGMGRINSAWTYGGHKMLYNTFKHNFGITPDHYILIHFSAFKKIIDGLGGLVVNVSVPLSDYRYGYWVTIPAGEVHMDADKILWYVRSRKTTNDFARNRRQQEVLQAIFAKLMSLNAIRRAPEFFELYYDGVKTDIRIMDVLAWLPLIAKVADSSNIKHYYISHNNVYDWITPEGAMVLVPNQASVMQVIRKSQNIR